MTASALLIIDVQVGFLAGQFAVHDASALLDKVLRLVASARQTGVPVVFIRHDESPEYDGPLHPDLAVRPDEPIVPKLTPNAFHETRLADVLQGLGVQHLILAGLQTDICLAATSQEAHERGYTVTIVEDGHSTIDSGGQTAPAIIAAYNAQFRRFARVVPLGAVFAG